MNYEFSKEEIELPNEGFSFMASLVEKQLDEIEKLSVEYAGNPRAKNANRLREAAQLNITSVRKTLEELRTECSSDQEAANVLFRYVLGLERRRIDFLMTLDREDTSGTYVVTNIQDFDQLHISIGQSQKTTVQSATSLYQASFEKDISILKDRSEKSYKEKPSTIRTERAKVVGKHALDVAKIGVGVIGGLLIAKKTKLL